MASDFVTIGNKRRDNRSRATNFLTGVSWSGPDIVRMTACDMRKLLYMGRGGVSSKTPRGAVV